MGVFASKSSSRNIPNQRLLQAATEGNLHRVRRSLSRGADINTKGVKDNRTPLHRAASKGHIQVVSYLCEHSANVDSAANDALTPLHAAVQSGQTQVVEFLLQQGANPNSTNKEGATPLHSASKLGRMEILQILCEKGADHSAADLEGNTCMHYAAIHDQVNVVSELHKHGANANAKNKNGDTPLHVAAANIDLVITLLECGANLGAKNADKRSVLDEFTGRFGSELGYLIECIRDACPEALTQL